MHFTSMDTNPVKQVRFGGKYFRRWGDVLQTLWSEKASIGD